MSLLVWSIGGVPGKIVGVGIMAGRTALAGVVAGLALLGEYEHFYQKFPEAFGPAIAVGIGLAAACIVADFIIGAVQGGKPSQVH